MIQPQVNSLVVAGQYKEAINILERSRLSYGKQNQLLYLLDYGFVLHTAGRYEESIKILEEAKQLYDRYYTISLSNQATTWLMNDNLAPYRGEDFERVMINIFQAINYCATGNIEEALVEARDADEKLKLINAQYKTDEKNTYREDAFIRMLMGVLYEMERTYEGYNNAFISYAKAVDIYEGDFKKNYGVDIPNLLKENILAVSQFMGEQEYVKYKDKFADKTFKSLKEKQNKGQIIFIHYYGFSPIKHQVDVPIPLPGGYVGKLSFPRYDKRVVLNENSSAQILNDQGAFVEEVLLEKASDISAIAIESLNNRKVRVMAKALSRVAGKYFIEKSIENKISNEFSEDKSEWFKYVASLYNIASEQADLRSWLALPAEIRMGRFIVDEGSYMLMFNKEQVGNVSVKKGEIKIITFRSR